MSSSVIFDFPVNWDLYFSSQEISLPVFSEYFLDCEVISPSVMPYKAIRSISHGRWVQLIKETIPQFEKEFEDNKNNELTTSCVNTAFTLLNLFLGQEKANDINKRLAAPCCEKFVKISKNILSLKIEHVFAGQAINALNKSDGHIQLGETELISVINRLAASVIDAFEIAIKKPIEELFLINEKPSTMVIHERIIGAKFDFNEPIINALENEMIQNEKLVSMNQSFLYTVGILSQNYSKTRRIYEPGPLAYDHIFLLEQFKSSTNKLRYRLYQSLVKTEDLFKNFEKNGYDEGEAGTWDSEGLKTFFQKFRRFYLVQQNEGLSEKDIDELISDSCEDCFGYQMEKLPQYTIDDENHLRGRSIRYISTPFCPVTVAQHVQLKGEE